MNLLLLNILKKSSYLHCVLFLREKVSLALMQLLFSQKKHQNADNFREHFQDKWGITNITTLVSLPRQSWRAPGELISKGAAGPPYCRNCRQRLRMFQGGCVFAKRPRLQHRQALKTTKQTAQTPLQAPLILCMN